MTDRRQGASGELRAVFFGAGGRFSIPSLRTLLVGGVNVGAVVLVAPSAMAGSTSIRMFPLTGATSGRTELPLLGGDREKGIAALARERGIPVLEARDLGTGAFLDTLRAYRPDIICVACFPRRLPTAVLEIPPLGCLNVHPSLLPHNRGPAPLFWTFRDGLRTTGVTVHIMSEEIDAGSIVEQARIDVPDGITGEEMDRRCAGLGGELLLRAVRGLAAGSSKPMQQVGRAASYRGWPTDRDFDIPTNWSARRAFNFVRGVSDWPRSPVLAVGDERITMQQVGGYDARATLPRLVMADGPELLVRFSSGVLRITAWH